MVARRDRAFGECLPPPAKGQWRLRCSDCGLITDCRKGNRPPNGCRDCFAQPRRFEVVPDGIPAAGCLRLGRHLHWWPDLKHSVDMPSRGGKIYVCPSCGAVDAVYRRCYVAGSCCRRAGRIVEFHPSLRIVAVEGGDYLIYIRRGAVA